jgi:hypothetical protein
MKRRRFLFWISFGLFGLAEKLHFNPLDRLAAAAMQLADDAPQTSSTDPPEHWSMAENNNWYWYERENYTGKRWKVTGITTPISKTTGEPYTGRSGYLDESQVPVEMRTGAQSIPDDDSSSPFEPAPFMPDATRQARHGRPPSRWLRSLNADELRIWLKTIDVPEAGVEGMTYWTHLTRDHFFNPRKIAGLALDDQAKLHAAAHFGY